MFSTATTPLRAMDEAALLSCARRICRLALVNSFPLRVQAPAFL